MLPSSSLKLFQFHFHHHQAAAAATTTNISFTLSWKIYGYSYRLILKAMRSEGILFELTDMMWY